MSDPRFNGSHLELPRRERYDIARSGVFDSCGPLTMHKDQFASLCRIRPIPQPLPASHTPYVLRDGFHDRNYPLHQGLNTVGRAPENDILLCDNFISRRHCAIIVHATGGCEVHDMASRNGVWVNGRRVVRVWLVPGDRLAIGGWELVLTTPLNRNEMVFAGSHGGPELATPPPTTAVNAALWSVWCNI